MAECSITVVVTAYNEQKTIESVVRRTLAVLESLTREYEVIIVDDASTDATPKIADRLADEKSKVHVVHHADNRGFGGALQSGFLLAKHDLVSLIPADGEFYPEELPRFVAGIEGSDVVTSYVPEYRLPFYRLAMHRGIRLLMRLILGPCPRIQGIYLFRRELLDGMQLHLITGLLNTEFLLKARDSGARFREIPMEVHPREDMSESKVTNLRTIANTFWEIIELRRILRDPAPHDRQAERSKDSFHAQDATREW